MYPLSSKSDKIALLSDLANISVNVFKEIKSFSSISRNKDLKSQVFIEDVLFIRKF